VYRYSSFGAGIRPVWMSSVQCNGTEASLKNCNFPGFGVVPSRIRIDLFAAGVVCFGKCVYEPYPQCCHQTKHISWGMHAIITCSCACVK